MDLLEFQPQFDPLEPTATTDDRGGEAHHHHRSDTRKRICTGGCDRPINVCLCDKIPGDPISTSVQIIILQHPHECRHKLATVPVLRKCLRNCQILVGRRLRYGRSPLLDSLYDAAVENPNEPARAIYLFPGSDLTTSVEISQWRFSNSEACLSNYVLIAFDGTWKHAKEMVHASLSSLSKFAVCVCLNYDVGMDGGTIFDSDLILRKEPFSGCMSTLEAIARALRLIEPNGVDIEQRLVEVLRAMVGFQVLYLKPMKPRSKLLKKGKQMEDKNLST